MTYITTEAALEYAELMGLEVPPDFDAILPRAAVYLDRIYGQRFIDFADGEYPAAVGQAQVELAMMIADNDGVLPPVPARIKRKSITLDEIKTDIEYADASGYAASPYDALEAILGPYLRVATVSGPRRRLTMTRGA